MSFCRITGRARNLPKSNYFPLTSKYTAESLRRFCRITGKSYGLPAHHFEPVLLKKKSKKPLNGDFHLNSRDPNYGNRKHKIVSSQKYMIADFESADELLGILEDILENEIVEVEDANKKFVYKIGENKSHLIISAKMEAAIRSGAIEDIMFAKDGETIVIKTRSGQLIPMDLHQVKGRAIGDLFEGEGKHDEESLETEMKRVTVAMRKLKLYDKIAASVIGGTEKHVKGEEGGKIKKIKELLQNEQYSGMLMNFLDQCVGNIICGAQNNGTPIKGLKKKAHKDQKIVHILKMMFNTSPEITEMQKLMVEQEEGENIRDRINGTVERYTPGTLDFVIANLNSGDPNEAVLNILQMSIQSFLRNAIDDGNSKSIAKKNGSNGYQNGLLKVNMTEFQEFLDETVGLMNCLTRNCGEAACYGADVQTILMDFVHRNAERCKFETPKVEMIMEIVVRRSPVMFHTDDEYQLRKYLKKNKKKLKDTVLVIREGIKIIVPKSMLRYIGDKSITAVELTEEGVDFVIDAIDDEDDLLLSGALADGLTDGLVNVKEYRSRRPRRQTKDDSTIVKGENYSNGSKKQKKRQQQKQLINPNYKNVYKKYEMINNSMYMFRAYTHTQGPNKTAGTRY